ncbi:MAG: glucosylceramidase [Bacteroidetes bacterium]|nr:glucosylceramidase [Bacteroidota bacterium]
MKIRPLLLLMLILLSGCKDKVKSEPIPEIPEGPVKTDVELWMTNPLASILFQKQNVSLLFNTTSNAFPVITVDTAETFQTMDGFGYTLTGGSALHLHNMSATNRTALLKELFATDATNIGVSYLRLSIGASDLDEKLFSYNDLPSGETDVEMKKFDLDYDKLHLLPVLKEILSINPNIKILGSPWSAPTWMKTNNDTRGGSLKPEYYDAYALYFLKYIQAMKAEGITIDAITIQNEPLHPGNNPSMFMPDTAQANFIKKSLGPAFVANNIKTKIIVYDHNADRPDYPITIYKDAEASKYVDGAAFHLYGGQIEALSNVYKAYPDKNLYFTEQWVGAPGDMAGDIAWHVKTLIIGGSRNWCKTVLEWNLANNPENKPHTDRGGCDRCLGAIIIDGDYVKRNPAYYIIAHASKFVRPGSVRIASNLVDGLPNVAFKTPEGKKVLIVFNDTASTQEFNIKAAGKTVTSKLDKGAVGTYIW